MDAKLRQARGFTLIELIITLLVVSLLLTMAVPGMYRFFDSKRLIGAAEQAYSHLQLVRMEAIARSRTMSANFSANGSTTWQYGVSHNSMCDLTTIAVTDANACVVVTDDGDGNADPGDGSVDTGDLVLMRFSDTDHHRVSMNIANFASGNTQIQFDSVRGTATAGDINFTSEGGKQLKVKVGMLGQIRVCSPDGSMSRYSMADC